MDTEVYYEYVDSVCLIEFTDGEKSTWIASNQILLSMESDAPSGAIDTILSDFLAFEPGAALVGQIPELCL